MTKLYERAYVQVPYKRAPGCLKSYLETQGWRPGETPVLHLHVNARDFGIPSDVRLERDVIARFLAGYDPLHLTKPMSVEWEPSGGGPFPHFKGTLTISEDEDYGSCVITLSGGYAPPLGAVGLGFDAVLGQRIALATARHLLQEIRDGMEAAQRAESSGKP